jgi:hypothetical protein
MRKRVINIIRNTKHYDDKANESAFKALYLLWYLSNNDADDKVISKLFDNNDYFKDSRFFYWLNKTWLCEQCSHNYASAINKGYRVLLSKLKQGTKAEKAKIKWGMPKNVPLLVNEDGFQYEIQSKILAINSAIELIIKPHASSEDIVIGWQQLKKTNLLSEIASPKTYLRLRSDDSWNKELKKGGLEDTFVATWYAQKFINITDKHIRFKKSIQAIINTKKETEINNKSPANSLAKSIKLANKSNYKSALAHLRVWVPGNHIQLKLRFVKAVLNEFDKKDSLQQSSSSGTRRPKKHMFGNHSIIAGIRSRH